MPWGMKAMTNKALAIASHEFKTEDELFLDTNIWLLVFGPQNPGDWRVEAYSQALAKILTAQCQIYIDVLIVSEFINTYARVKWGVLGRPHGNFKRFRNSPDFKPIAQDIAADVGRVLRHCSRVESGFKTLDINGLITEYAAGDSDFNDQMIAALCQRKGLKLVTDDADFSGHQIQIVTANRRLLA